MGISSARLKRDRDSIAFKRNQRRSPLIAFAINVDAARKARLPPGTTFGQVVSALADAGFRGATASELQNPGRHMRGFSAIRQDRFMLRKRTPDRMMEARSTDLALSHPDLPSCHPAITRQIEADRAQKNLPA